MASATLTSKGQVTIPKAILDYLKIDTGSQVDFIIDENGEVKIIPLNVPVHALSGILHRPEMRPASIEEMEKAIADAARDWA